MEMPFWLKDLVFPPRAPAASPRFFGLREMELWAAARDNKFVHRQGFGFDVRREVEAVGEQWDDHGGDLLAAQLGGSTTIGRNDLGFDVEARGADGAGEADDLIFVDVVGEFNDLL